MHLPDYFRAYWNRKHHSTINYLRYKSLNETYFNPLYIFYWTEYSRTWNVRHRQTHNAGCRFLDIVKFITAFTIGHSITLLFVTLFQLQANYYLIDSIIALTVCYKAFENLDGFKKHLNINPPNLIWMVFSFGLSTRLQTLPMNQDN